MQRGVMKAKGRVEPRIHSKYNRRLQWHMRCNTNPVLYQINYYQVHSGFIHPHCSVKGGKIFS